MRFSLRAGYGDGVAGSHPAPLPQRGTGLARSGTGPFPMHSSPCILPHAFPPCPPCFFPAHFRGYRADRTTRGERPCG
jgi:hypothetical protein